MYKKRIIKILSLIVALLSFKVLFFGWLHLEGSEAMTIHVVLPIIVHMLGGLGTVFLAWWLVDADLRSQAKKDDWEKVLGKAFSDLRRNVWLARELKVKDVAADGAKVYGRYWITGLDELRQALPKKHTKLEHELWSLIHQFDVGNKMLEDRSVAEAAEQADILSSQIKALEPSLNGLSQGLVGLEVEGPNFSSLFVAWKEELQSAKTAHPEPAMI